MMLFPSLKVSSRERIVLAVTLALLWLIARHYISNMDDRFFQPSLLGIKGLILYELGDYNGAAKAYRAHFQKEVQAGLSSGDPVSDTLLNSDLYAAKERARRELEEDPKAVDALLILGSIALQDKALDEALNYFESIHQQEVDHPEAYLMKSVVRAMAGAYGEAIDAMNFGLRTNRMYSRLIFFLYALETTGELATLPDRDRPHCLLAHYYRYLRIFDHSNGDIAVNHAEQAIDHGDRPADAYLTMGVIYEKKGKTQEALQAFLKAIEVNPQHAEALRWTSVLYGKRGDLLNEYRMVKAAYEAAPHDTFYVEGLRRYLVNKLGDFRQALDLTMAVLRTKPVDIEEIIRAGHLNLVIGEDEQALGYYRKAIQLQPQNPSTHENLGTALLELERTDEAREAYRTSLRIDPSRPGSHRGMSFIYVKEGLYRQAIDESVQAIKHGERDINYRANLCGLYHWVGEFRHAATCFEQVLMEDPKNVAAQHLLPYIYKNLRREGLR